MRDASFTQYRTKTEVAYEAIKESILVGRFRPGERLMPRSLAQEFGMSEIPIREGLQRLANEGLVTILPHVGVRVSDLPVEGVVENLMIRAELEALAARIAVDYVGDETIAELESLVAEMDRCLDEGSVDRYSALNRRFHLAIYDVIPYRQLFRLIEDLWNRVPRARSVFLLVPDHVRESQREHAEILQALRERDADRAQMLVRAHKQRAREALARLKSSPGGFGEHRAG